VKLGLKFSIAMQIPLRTDRQKMFFIRNYNELLYAERRLEIAERRLAQRCQEAMNKHELAKIRREAAQERAERKAAADARRTEQRELKRLARERQIAQRRDRDLAENQAAAARAASSPLAQIEWRCSTDPTHDAEEKAEEKVPVPHVVDQTRMDVGNRAAGRNSGGLGKDGSAAEPVGRRGADRVRAPRIPRDQAKRLPAKKPPEDSPFDQYSCDHNSFDQARPLCMQDGYREA
jgi:hypothetical protein